MTFATLETEKGIIEIELFDEETPNTVKSFVSLIEKRFYDGIKFHRVIPKFVIQGGDPTGTGSGGPGYRIPCEVDAPKQEHKLGALSMAHAGRNTGGSQFFVVTDEQNTKHLNRNHTVFGQTIKGIEVVNSIIQGDKILKATVRHISEKIKNWQLKKM